MPGARRAVALRDQQFLQGDEPRVGEQHAHAGADGRRHTSADEEDAKKRADGDADDEQAGRPEQKVVQKRRNAHVRRVHQHHGHEREVVADR